MDLQWVTLHIHTYWIVTLHIHTYWIVTLHIHTYWIILAYCLTNMSPMGFLKKVPPRIRMDNKIMFLVDSLRTWSPIFGLTHYASLVCFHFTLLFALRMPGTAAQRRYCHSQSRILGVHKNSRLITARQVHAYMVPNMQKNGCVRNTRRQAHFHMKYTSYIYIYIYIIIYIYIYILYSEVSWNGGFNKIFHYKH